jgi:hypothetical protein
MDVASSTIFSASPDRDIDLVEAGRAMVDHDLAHDVRS